MNIADVLNKIPTEMAQNAVNAVQDSVTNAVSSAQSKINDAAQQMQQRIGDAQQNLQNIMGNATKSIQDTVGQQSQAVQKCVSQNGSPVDAALASAQNTVQGCIGKQVNQAMDLANKVKNEIGSAMSNIAEIRDSLGNCSVDAHLSIAGLPQINASQASCMAGSMSKIKVDTLVLPLNLAQDAAAAVAQIQGLQGAAIQCQVELVTSVTKASVINSATIAKCVVNPSS